MSRYKAYPAYKESHIGWMGPVPEGWCIIPCRAVVEDIAEKNVGAADQNYLSVMANVGVIKYEDKGDIGNKKPDDLSKCKIVKAGNLVINSMNYAIGSYGMSPYNGVCSPVYIVLGVNEEAMESRFALRIFENTPFQKYLATFGNGILEHRAAIGWDDIKGAHIAVPSKYEQRAILNFLDHETAKIDALIKKQQRLIELLKEKRQAVISHAVTKGLSPNAQMKDSGVERLGEVPAHWRVSKCGFHVSILPGYAFQSSGFSESDEDTKLLRGINVGVNSLKWDEVVYWKRKPSDGLDAYVMQEGDIVIGMDRPLISDGIRVAKVKESDLPCLLLQRVASIKTSEHLDADYLLMLLSSNMFSAHFAPDTTGVSVPHISPDQIGNFVIPIPTVDEQKRIVFFVSSASRKLIELLSKAEEAIALMKERRTALISAAVTGKIDVRDWQAAA
ncbi:restriction endonuclease subunit S [Lampropedia aestuarii]|uniref:restriction endonuclease subunit S n=1 Tax=Lampropedia aestuarii TaxID=2562762 RepID=UPI002468C1FD|nr:restriction endonuclease subunit S [Lampropedia aestuarii]MDH5856231.1 restriction endonuclease subunit S [Lampropedia aestuarii]